MESRVEFPGYLLGEDSIEFFGLSANRIFSEEPKWFVEAVENGDIFLDDSDELMKVKVDGEFKVVQPGEYITQRTFSGGLKQIVVEN